jgi:hypothetical protein
VIIRAMVTIPVPIGVVFQLRLVRLSTLCCSDVSAGVVGTYCVGSIGAEGIDVNDLVTCQCQETAKQAADVAIRADCYWYEAIITMN